MVRRMAWEREPLPVPATQKALKAWTQVFRTCLNCTFSISFCRMIQDYGFSCFTGANTAPSGLRAERVGIKHVARKQKREMKPAEQRASLFLHSASEVDATFPSGPSLH